LVGSITRSETPYEAARVRVQVVPPFVETYTPGPDPVLVGRQAIVPLEVTPPLVFDARISAELLGLIRILDIVEEPNVDAPSKDHVDPPLADFSMPAP
jgi:hypothetical protein